MTVATIPIVSSRVDNPVISLNGERFVKHIPSTSRGVNYDALLLAQCTSSGASMDLDQQTRGAGAIHRVTYEYRDTCHELGAGYEQKGIGVGSYWHVALLNPEPVDGRWYRTIAEGDRPSLLVQYWGETGDARRYNAGDPWNIMYGSTAPWPAGPDSFGPSALTTTSDMKYVEVEMTEVSQFLGKDAPAAEAEAETETETEAPTVEMPVGALGLVKMNEDGTLPELTQPHPVGSLVIAWRKSNSDAGRIAYLGMRARDDRASAIARIDYDGTTHSLSHGTGNILAIEFDWLPAVLPPTPTRAVQANPERVAQLQSQLDAKVEAFDQFNTDLNEVAADKSWCGEYEEVITPYGMKPRRGGSNVEYRVDISAEVILVDSDPSSSIDSSLEDAWGANSFSSTNVETRGTMNVSVFVTLPDDTDTDDMDDHISTEMVENAINEQLSGVSLQSLEDWTVEDTTVNDD